MGDRNGPQVESAQAMVSLFHTEVVGQLKGWGESLQEDPAGLQQLEADIGKQFARGADMVVAGLLHQTMRAPSFELNSEKTRKRFSRPLQKGCERTVAIRLIGGMLVWATTMYCSPKKKRNDDDAEPRTGLDVTLAAFGFGKGVSPGLESRVARCVALTPSIAFAHRELVRDGVDLNAKTVKRITYQCGEGLLALRRHRVELLRQGKLPAGDELAGKRVSVQIDGGRIKIRGKMRPKTKSSNSTVAEGSPSEEAAGRSKKRAKQTYETDWREPKLVTIFIHDEDGKMAKKTQSTIDGTLMGPDATAEIVAMHLHRLGGAKAKSITFVSDGAPWIWDRIAAIIKLAKLNDVETHQVLDCCHAVHHVSLALKSLSLSQEERAPLYREHRTLLRNGQWRKVVEELNELDNPKDPNKELQTQISYLRRHGEAGRMSYVSYRRQGIPCGSGAIESSIRRVINLRLKSNAMFWKSENAESMLQVRSQVIPDRWDAAISELGEFRRTQAWSDWKWKPQKMAVKTEDSQSLAV